MVRLEQYFNQILIDGTQIQRNSTAYNIIMALIRQRNDVLGVEENSVNVASIGERVESARHFLNAWSDERQRILRGDFVGWYRLCYE